nr:MAG TPA: hypothetical protein [Caudoviricetes sp.]
MKPVSQSAGQPLSPSPWVSVGRYPGRSAGIQVGCR